MSVEPDLPTSTPPGRLKTIRHIVPLRLVGGLVVVAAAVAAFQLDLLASGMGRLDPVAPFLLAVALVVFVSHLLGTVMERFHQPRVLGEILGGLLLGPSALTTLWPEAGTWLFTAPVMSALGMVSQLGLVTFMFLLGCELGRGGVRTSRGVVALVSVGAIGLPFLGGAGLALFGQGALAGDSSNHTAYVVFFGLALSITALPVLARVLLDLRMESTRIGTLALACAASGDGLIWMALTVVLGLSGGTSILTTVGVGVALALITMLWVRPALTAMIRRAESRGSARQFLLPVLLAGALGYAAITHMMGLHPAIGAFLFGVVVPRDVPVMEHLKLQLQGFVITVLLPLFFAGIGLTTSVGLIGGSVAHWGLFVAVLLTAIATKFAGAVGFARLASLPQRDAWRLGALMNCRGVTELVVAAIGYQHHLISALGLTMLVLVALITTAATRPLIHLIGLPADVGTADATAT
ncbi:cation:proton antiporter [Nonomuraea sp. NPDC050556]|uniref:cation:proton antiporter domain-containing protein n=1 Tax=Nonomuraea sp. NPDC050556 TaxID=3364369 RepID=UPI00379FA448